MGAADALFLLVRIALVSAVPVIASIASIEVGSLVPLFSGLAVLFELALVTCLQAGAGAKGKRSIRPARIFPLQLGALYAVQLWWLCLHAVSASPSRAHAVNEPGAVSPPAPAKAGRPQAFLELGADVASASSSLGDHVQPIETVPARMGQVPDAARSVSVAQPVQPARTAAVAQTAEVQDLAVQIAGLANTGGFVLEAPAESLRWTPKTMSVVLPCAEERELALKTVISVFNSLPPEKLHEIVVVDDGSNPPLSTTHLQPSVQQQYKVKIMRHEDTVGLIGAKKTGGDAAAGDIVVFFDCHVAPQDNWYKDFFDLISENYRRMVVPQITALDINTWTQVGNGGGMAKCYVTWDGDFKWGGEDDMYMAMISGGLLAMSRRWWQETGGYDAQMFGWGGENIDQAIRVWVCGGEIVAAPNAQVAHMWRTGDGKTNARYKHVGDTIHNRGRAIYAWYGDFTAKLDHYPSFAHRKSAEGDAWVGDMSSFQQVKDRLQGCRPFAWYLKRFKGIYEDAGILPNEVFMLKEQKTGHCLLFQGQAGTSGSGREGVVLADCDANNHRFFWHAGNRDSRKKHKCCSGLRAWNTDQCLQGGQPGGIKAATGICEISGRNPNQRWMMTSDGQIRNGGRCLGPGNGANTIMETSCDYLTGVKFLKWGQMEPLETQLYRKTQREHPEVFQKLEEEQKSREAESLTPPACRRNPAGCIVLTLADGKGRCLSDDGHLTTEQDACAAMLFDNGALKQADSGICLDTWSDESAETWGFYGCHGGFNQRFARNADGRICVQAYGSRECFETRAWTAVH